MNKKYNTIKNAIGYIRTRDIDPRGVAEQYQSIVRYANANGYKILYFYCDMGFSGIDDNRPDFQNMCRHATGAPNWDTIIMAEPSVFFLGSKMFTSYMNAFDSIDINIVFANPYNCQHATSTICSTVPKTGYASKASCVAR